MESFVINGGRRLSGTLRVDGAKNAALPILAASVLTEDAVQLHHVPDILDVRRMTDILRMLGCEVAWCGHEVTVRAGSMNSSEMPDELSKQIRSSIFLLGPILSRFRRATVTYPGGCEIGLRPIDLHLSGLRALGVDVREEGGVIRCDGSHMHAGEVHLDYPSVGATENVIMAAVCLDGTTTIHNAAREPEIVDLCRFITAMGGRIRGAGCATVQVDGVKRLHGAAYTPMPDRIVAATYLCAAAACGGEVELLQTDGNLLQPVLEALTRSGCELEQEMERIRIRSSGELCSCGSLESM